MSLPASPPANAPTPWQSQLSEHCRRTKLAPPVFNIVSDRRGGRTAWSSTVTVQGRNVAARYWYDGQYINNAKEDAAEVALKQLLNQPRAPAATVYPGQVYPQGYGGNGGL
ncbi:hypothetical protein N7520_001552 [Penicillium odoratum]|uniref:uncharacterized protein n=1 Tax=Penicillium odoratum TaxID=1167516 RepID=UPI0025475DC6|nr:uncharacterized protein N7520_001552 [Penicillium odoratum]KAJ5778306.1 hypothetical protein N7520_001552 [Penicillium odoratum]